MKRSGHFSHYCLGEETVLSREWDTALVALDEVLKRLEAADLRNACHTEMVSTGVALILDIDLKLRERPSVAGEVLIL